MIFDKPAYFSHGILAIDVSKSKAPGVVRVDVGALPLAHFLVRPDGDGAVLGYMDAAARFTPLAVFADRKDADRVLRAVKKRIMQPSLALRILKNTVILVSVFILLLFIQGYIINMNNPGGGVTPQGPSKGVPMNADDRFNDDD